jgi:hypothetical protein
MKTARLMGAALALALAMGGAYPASAQQRPSIAIMPTAYFSATAGSAQNVTQGLVEQFQGRGYTVVPMERSRATFDSLGLGLNTHYADAAALRFGRSIGSDLVAYPRLLTVGIPLGNVLAGAPPTPAAVMHLRVLNVHSGGPIYFRQVGHEFSAPPPDDPRAFELPGPVAAATAADVLEVYFRTVAGSAREMRGTR